MTEPITDEELDGLRQRCLSNAAPSDAVFSVPSLIARIDAEKARADRYEAAFRAFCEGLRMREVDQILKFGPRQAKALGEKMAKTIIQRIAGGIAPPAEKEE